MYNNRTGTVSFSAQRIFTPAVIITCILIGIGYGAVAFAREFVEKWLVLSNTNLASGKIWTLVTHSYINGCGWPMVWDLLALLFLGSAIESKWGAKSWIIFWVIISVVCGLLYMLAGLLWRPIAIATSGSCVFGLIGAFGLIFRHNYSYSMLGAIKAHHAAWILIAIGILLSLPQPVSLISVAGAAAGYGYVKLLWKLDERKNAARPATTGKRPGAFVDVD